MFLKICFFKIPSHQRRLLIVISPWNEYNFPTKGTLTILPESVQHCYFHVQVRDLSNSCYEANMNPWINSYNRSSWFIFYLCPLCIFLEVCLFFWSSAQQEVVSWVLLCLAGQMLLSAFPAGNCGSKLPSFFETLADHTASPWRLQKTQRLWELVQIKFTGCLDPNPDGKLWLVILFKILQSLYNRIYIIYLTDWYMKSSKLHSTHHYESIQFGDYHDIT